MVIVINIIKGIIDKIIKISLFVYISVWNVSSAFELLSISQSIKIITEQNNFPEKLYFWKIDI